MWGRPWFLMWQLQTMASYVMVGDHSSVAVKGIWQPGLFSFFPAHQPTPLGTVLAWPLDPCLQREDDGVWGFQPWSKSPTHTYKHTETHTAQTLWAYPRIRRRWGQFMSAWHQAFSAFWVDMYCCKTVWRWGVLCFLLCNTQWDDDPLFRHRAYPYMTHFW